MMDKNITIINSFTSNGVNSGNSGERNKGGNDNSYYSDMRRITFLIPKELFKELKRIGVEKNLTMLEIGEMMTRDFVRKHK